MATSMRAYLSDELLARRTGKAAVRAVVRDSRLSGFQCVIGARSKVFRLRLHRGCITLGSWPVLTAEQARTKALDLLRDLAEGKPLSLRAGAPAGEAAPPAPSLAAVLDDYLATKSLKPSTVRDLRNRLHVHCADWLAAPVSAVTPDAFEARYRDIASASAANAVACYLSALLNFANARHGLTLENPVARLRKPDGLREVKPKDRMVPDALLPAWSAALAALAALADRDAADALRFLALTSVRLNEALHLTWADTDLAAGSVRFRDTKNGTDHALPLGPHLRALLAARAGGAGAVFAATERRLRVAYEAVGETIGFAWSPHDLRRGFVTVGQRTLNDLATVKRLVNHAANGDVTTRHYLRLAVEDLREPMQRIEAAFLRLWGGRAPNPGATPPVEVRVGNKDGNTASAREAARSPRRARLEAAAGSSGRKQRPEAAKEAAPRARGAAGNALALTIGTMRSAPRARGRRSGPTCRSARSEQRPAREGPPVVRSRSEPGGCLNARRS